MSKLVISLLLCLVVVLQYQLWFSQSGLISTSDLKQSIYHAEQNELLLEQKNQRLLAEINDLRTHSSAVAAYVRYDLGMIKPTETFYQLVKPY